MARSNRLHAGSSKREGHLILRGPDLRLMSCKTGFFRNAPDDRERPFMHSVLYHLTTISVLAVIVVLVLGLWTLLRGKSPNLSQKLMRWRIGLQFFAILVIIGYAVVSR